MSTGGPSPRIRIEKMSDRELVFYLEDEDKHSLSNLIAKLALKKPHVVYSAYTIDHPLVSYPRVSIVTDGERDPREVLIEVLEEVRDYLVRIRSLIEQRIPEKE